MAGFLGADTVQLRDHAQLVQQKAQRIIELREQLAPLVMNEAIWCGADAEEFRARWSGQIVEQFAEREGELTATQQDLDRQAEEQDTASREGGAGGEAGPGESAGKGEEGSFSFKDLVKKLDAVLKKIMDVNKYRALWSGLCEVTEEVAKRAKVEEIVKEIAKTGKGWSEMFRKVANKLGVPYFVLDRFKPLVEKLNKLNDVAPWMKGVGKYAGRFLPGVDIISGGYQLFTADDTFAKVTGGASALSGALMLAAPFTGPAAPVVAGVGAAIGAGAAIADLGKMAWDNREAIGNAVSTGVQAVGSAASAAGEAIGNGAKAVGNAMGNAAGAVSDFVGGLF